MSEPRFLCRSRLDQLLEAIASFGYQAIGPRHRDGAIVYERLTSADQLPRGVRDAQAPGRYRLHRDSAGERCFAFACGSQALKPLFFAGQETLWEAVRDEKGFTAQGCYPEAVAPLAVLGARACDIAALALHDAHFLGQRDQHYAARRAGLLLVAVNCSHAASTCFCASTGDGPEVRQGYDLLLDELDDGYLIRAGSRRGEELLGELETHAATDAQLAAAGEQLQRAADQSRRLPGGNLSDRLFANLDHPRWEETAKRCLSCGNCTAVCPSCFCHAQVEEPELDGSRSRHQRVWDSCFTEGHSLIHGIPIRGDTAKRYRQWLTHKLGGWHEQYGRSGCVGCGRCITWCPAGIDITEEAHAVAGGGK